MARRSAKWEEVIVWLDKHPGKHTYGTISEKVLGYPASDGSQAVGSCMRAICARGKHAYCRRVIDAETREPNCGGGAPSRRK